MLKIGGKRIDPHAPAPELKPKDGQRLRVSVEKTRFAVIVDGREVLAGLRTVDNIELIADLLSAYGHPREAMELRRGKYLR